MKTKTAVQPIASPGQVLSHLLKKEHITQVQLAKHLSVAQSYVNDICRDRVGISAEMAKKLGAALSKDPRFWLDIKAAWELSQVDDSTIEHVEPIRLRA